VPVPKRKTGNTRRNKRRAHHALGKPAMSECGSCGERIRPHRVCPKCGHYNDRLIVNTEGD
jgi:large subunit ribosomal protein L32